MAERGEEKPAVVPGEVLELLQERARIEGWLEKLREFRTEATPEVYEKVRSDYEGRAHDVSARLAEHRSDLESSLAGHRHRVDELQGARDAAAARLEEAELRFRVGEYGDQEWERRRDEGEAEIEALDVELNEERRAVAALEKVMGEFLVEARSADAEPAPDGPKRPSAPASTAEVGSDRTPASEPAAASEAPPGDAGLAAAEATDAPTAATAPEAVVPAEGPDSTTEPTRSPSEEEARPHNGRDAPQEEGLDALDDQSAEYLDELEFLESLSLDDAERFDAVSLMLDETEEEEEGEEPGRREPRSP